MLLEIPVIISIGSDDILATDNFIHAHGGDDDCWTVFNDEYNSKAQSNKNKIQEKPYIILHQTFLIIYLERVYVYRRSHTSPIIISTMYTHLHCSVSMMLRSAQKSKQYSFHNACKRIAHEKPYNLTSDISDNLS